MTILALCSRVFTIQWEEVSMVEITQPVDAIMTYDAIGAELPLVVGHEHHIMLVMAIDACLYFGGL